MGTRGDPDARIAATIQRYAISVGATFITARPELLDRSVATRRQGDGAAEATPYVPG